VGGPKLFEIAGMGWPVVWITVVLTILGIAFGIRGFWGSDRRSRRIAILVGIVVLTLTFVFSSYVLLEGFQQIARLGPAATAADMGTVWRRALSPAMVGVGAFLLLALIAGAGWVLQSAPVDPDAPPRRPVR
jgi:hypothetical protein